MATTMDASVACTAAVRALDRRVRERAAREASAVIALRAAVESARGVIELRAWRFVAGQVLDGDWRDRPGVADMLCRLAARAVERARGTATFIAAGEAHSASLRWWEARGRR